MAAKKKTAKRKTAKRAVAAAKRPKAAARAPATKKIIKKAAKPAARKAVKKPVKAVTAVKKHGGVAVKQPPIKAVIQPAAKAPVARKSQVAPKGAKGVIAAAVAAKPAGNWPRGVEIIGAMKEGYEQILTREAVEFIVGLERMFGAERKRLLSLRIARQKQIDAGEKPDFLIDTRDIRDREWTVAPLPNDILDRRVEITGPIDRKMVINALNCGANVFMADCEDATTPTWSNLVEGQINLRDAVRRSITYTDPASGKFYQLADKTAVLFVRPRGWHLPEKHVLVDGEPMSGSLFDFGLYFFHNAKEALERGTGPYFYLPKLESHFEARLWNNVFNWAQDKLGVKRGSIKATVLIETILAAFEVDEILYELRDHSAGLNCGRWDYIFSFIKKFAEDPACVLPDRAQVTMTTHFLRQYSQLVIKTCHRRNVHAMGGMAAQIPIKDDHEANSAALAKVRTDKEREVGDGHDGTWVAHPGLVPIAKAVFDQFMTESNQIYRKRQDVHVTAADLLRVPQGQITEQGVRTNINVAIGYIEAWLRGSGCVPLYNLMEDAATAEISRAQIWQWIRHGCKLSDGRAVTKELCRQIIGEELDRYRAMVGAERYAKGQFGEAAKLVRDLIEAPTFPEFLTLPAYDLVVAHEAA
jgi:malate synthase